MRSRLQVCHVTGCAKRGLIAVALPPIASLNRKRQLLELCARIGYTPPRA